MLTQLIFALIVSSAPVAEHHAYQHSDAQNELLYFATMTQVLNPHLAEVWPNFWNKNTSFIVYNHDGETVLFTPYEPIAGYKELVDNYYYYPEGLPGLTDFHFYVNYPRPNDQAASGLMLSHQPLAVSLKPKNFIY